MTTVPAQNFSPSYSPKGLCRIVGFACLGGFLVDLFVLTLPPAFGTLQWRITFLQQLADRSVILLFGMALIMYGILDFRRWRRRLAMASLIFGIVFILSSILVIRDSLEFQQQAMANISNRASQVQSQLQQAQSNPKLAPRVKPEQLEQASQLLSNQLASAKETTKTSVLRTGISSVGNLIVIGLALIGLGQYGARPPKN
ncbi:HpsJ-like protein, cyanoexosortase C-associated [Leptodesmis sichuanensis]|uniref:HpsJ-like protein, cyanoexosortase C-associated n=1 Tax=Leptodesmis sichuanensis TaxID=2906798 RepID=UPI001F1D48FE|nr:HpsJ family protein [Leptodesmis sichuanensis]UIE36384.1 HpsJ family protein [Leptodesmis sichuanensis A121]